MTSPRCWLTKSSDMSVFQDVPSPKVQPGNDEASGASEGDPAQEATTSPEEVKEAAETEDITFLIMFSGLPTKHPQDEVPAHTI